MKINQKRRNIVKGAAAVLAAPFLHTNSFAADLDVVVVGAGAAGLAAARTLIEAGVTVKLLEANSRIGGRSITDTETFGVPFDRGASFLANGHRNPWIKYAKANGFKIDKMPGDNTSRVNVGHREATRNEYGEIFGNVEALFTAMAAVGQSDPDISLREAVSKVPTNEWSPLSEFFLRSVTGQEFENMSAKDFPDGDGDMYHCQAGYGTLVSHYGRNVPVELETTVSEIDWSGHGVRVVTDKGTIHARYCIVTVSVGVLAGGHITFTPKLPDRKSEALGGFDMGHYITVGMKFDTERFMPVKDNAWFWINGSHDEMLDMWSNIGKQGVSRAGASGDVARDLEVAGENAAIDFVLERLKHGIGSDAVKGFQRGLLTTWNNSSFTRGIYAMAKPGKSHLRRALGEAVGTQVLFAGEACHESMWITCQGALLSGQQVAKSLLRQLGE